MSPPSVTVRCPACGQTLRAVLATAPPTQWFPCPNCHRPVPVVAPRSPAPLYTWEVLDGLYPPLPAPRRPRLSATVLSSGLFATILVLSTVVAGALGVYAQEVNTRASFTVSGTVEVQYPHAAAQPVSGAQVTLRGEGGFVAFEFTDARGEFAFLGVPAGGINLTARSTPSYGVATVVTFVSSVYDAGSRGVALDLPLDPAATNTTALSPYPDLETFLAYDIAGIVLCATCAALSAVGIALARRPGAPIVGAIAAGAAVGLPGVAFVLALSVAFPLIGAGCAAVGGLGGFALVIEGARLWRRESEPAQRGGVPLERTRDGSG